MNQIEIDKILVYMRATFEKVQKENIPVVASWLVISLFLLVFVLLACVAIFGR